MLSEADSAIVKEAAEHLLYEGTPAMALHVHLYKIRVRHIIGCAAEVIEIIKQKLIDALTHSGYNVVFVEGKPRKRGWSRTTGDHPRTRIAPYWLSIAGRDGYFIVKKLLTYTA
jgi:hypothetical protein